MRLPTGKLHPRAIAGSKAKVGDALVWKGTEYKPGPVGALAIVNPTAPTAPAVGQLWYDTDATC